MEDATWEQRLQATTHLLTHPTTHPSLHSQFFISNHIPCYLNWDYPPILCNKKETQNKFPSLHLQWELSLFFKKVSRWGYPETSWRSKCAFQQPPPLILGKGVEEAPVQWEGDKLREYYRRRLRSKRFRSDVNPWIPFLVPNLLLLSLLLLDPLPID